MCRGVGHGAMMEDNRNKIRSWDWGSVASEALLLISGPYIDFAPSALLPRTKADHGRDCNLKRLHPVWSFSHTSDASSGSV